MIYGIAFLGIAILCIRFIFGLIYLFMELFCYKDLIVNKELAPIKRARKRFTRKINDLNLEVNAIDEGSLLPDVNCKDGNLNSGYLRVQNDNTNGSYDSLKITASNFDKINDTLFGSDMTDLMTDINGDYIRSIRRRKGISIKQLSKMTKIRKYRLRIIENNVDKPTLDEAIILKTELARS